MLSHCCHAPVRLLRRSFCYTAVWLCYCSPVLRLLSHHCGSNVTLLFLPAVCNSAVTMLLHPSDRAVTWGMRHACISVITVKLSKCHCAVRILSRARPIIIIFRGFCAWVSHMWVFQRPSHIIRDDVIWGQRFSNFSPHEDNHSWIVDLWTWFPVTIYLKCENFRKKLYENLIRIMCLVRNS